MHWADKYADEVIARNPQKKRYIVESGITPSGVVHAGNFREIMTQDLVYKALLDTGVKADYLYIWDDYDRFRKVPKGIPEEWENHIGLPISDTPDPWKCHGSYADHFKDALIEETKKCGVKPKYIHMSKEYKKCTFAENMKKALENALLVKQIHDAYREEPLEASWLPIRVYCEKCGKDTTKAKYPGGYVLSYSCVCGHDGEFDFRKKGIAKMPWRVCWPQRWVHYGVDFESSGKDHHASGGSWDTGTRICKEVYGVEPPIGPMYEFIGAKGQADKMSKSVGNTFTVSNLLEIYEPEMVRWFYTAKIDKYIEFPFDMDVINRYAYFDKMARVYFGEEKEENERDEENLKRCYEFAQITGKPEKALAPDFGACVNAIQLPYPPESTLIKQGAIPEKLSDADKRKLKLRLKLAKSWIEKYAPESARLTLLKQMPDTSKLTELQKDALLDLIPLLGQKDISIDEIAKRHGIGAKDVFQAAYYVLLGKERGPRLVPFINSLDAEFVRKRFSLKK